MAFQVKDILTPLYQEASQQFATLLLGDEGMYSAIDMALCDIYSYEGTNWGFMHRTQECTFEDTDNTIKEFTLEVPITRLSGNFINTNGTITKNKFKIVSSKYSMEGGDCSNGESLISFQPLDNKIYLSKEAGLTQIISYYGWYIKPTDLDSIVPLPDAFKSVLRDLALHYIIGPQGQYGEQKSGDLYNRGQEKLRQLARSGLGQISSITFK